MAIEVQNPYTDQSVTALVGDIMKDAQDLIKQQFKLARQELEVDLRKGKEAASVLAVGGFCALLGAFILCLMTAHLLYWLGAPPGSDPSRIPLWICYAIVGGFLAVGGMAGLWAGKKKVDAIGTPLQETTQALKENLQWTTQTR